MQQATMARASCGIAVMAKASKAGRTKTRLSPPLTLEEAANLNTVFLKDIAANLAAAAQTSQIAGYMAYGPTGAESFFREHLPPQIGLFEVWYPDFGRCLLRALEEQFERGHQAACVLNSDSPTLPVSLLQETAEVLARPGERIVLGPSTDGGYYILGCKQLYARLFQDITWSTDVVAAQTLERAAELGLEVHLLPKWYDVDDQESLSTVVRETLDGVPFSESLRSSPAHHTAEMLADMRKRSALDERLFGQAQNRHELESID